MTSGLGRRGGAAVLLILLASVIVAARFVRAIPAFENSDELQHLGYLLHLARTGALPRLEAPGRSLVRQEAIQPPLYYASALPFAGAVRAAAPQAPDFDPSFHFAPAFPGAGPHRYYQDPAKGPPRVRALAALCDHVRWVSVAWGLVAASMALGLFVRLARGDASHVSLALALFALNPRFVETCASFGNDVGGVALATAALWRAVVVLERRSAPRLQDGVVLGVLCGLAGLAKLNGLVVLVAALSALALARGSRRERAIATLALLATCGVLLAPWLLRNLDLYGDPSGLRPERLAPFVSVRATPFGPVDFMREEFQGLRWSYWAVFGQFAVLADPWLYPVLDAALLCGAVLAVAFLVRTARTAPDREAALAPFLPALFLAALFAAFLWHTSRVFGSQGRLLFPAAAPVAWLLAGGLLLPFPARARPWASAVGVAVMVAFASYVGWSVLPRAYR